ncbi:MAG: hypothetical protein ABIC19_02045 [Patescibacteria group bacterium]|nr:hypothetical protein [Patescibacteria group bacterium]
MTLKTYLGLMLGATVMAAVAWALVIYYIDPFKAGWVGLILFYTTLFFMLVGIFTVLGFRLRQRFLNNELLYVLIGLSFRQAVWVSIICVGLLLMQGAGILTWWDALLLVVAIIFLEAYFLSE